MDIPSDGEHRPGSVSSGPTPHTSESARRTPVTSWRPPQYKTGSQACSGHRLRVGRSPRCQAATRTPGGHNASTTGNASAEVDNAHPS